MDWYYYIALAAIAMQLLFLFYAYKNYRYALGKYKKTRPWQKMRVALIVPCKGLDAAFEKNITSFFNQDYDNYLLWFVVADENDPAYSQLCRLKDKLSSVSKAKDIQILAAGKAQARSQKIHNLLYCHQRISKDVDILAFADSDICIRSDWLIHLVWPLRNYKHGAASGYRWFIPAKVNLASLALSAINAKVAQLLGDTHFNQAWGGSMAMYVDVFRKIGLDKIWQSSLSDDLSLTYAIKKAGMRLDFVPACLVASYVSTNWGELFEFARRQFLITRINRPRIWWFGLLGSIYSVLGLWGGLVLAIYAAHKFLVLSFEFLVLLAVPVVFFTAQLIRAFLRQDMAQKLLTYEQQVTSDEQRAMRAAYLADVLLSWLWSVLMLVFIVSSAFGRTIRWRGIRYKLLSPTETVVETT